MQAGLGRFRVSWSEYSEVIEAADDREAWAKFCDKIKKYPSPKVGKVERVAA